MNKKALALACLTCGTSHRRNLQTSIALSRADGHQQLKLVDVDGTIAGRRTRSSKPVVARGLYSHLKALAMLVLAFNPVAAFNPSNSGRRLAFLDRRSHSKHSVQMVTEIASLKKLAGSPALLPELQAHTAAGVSPAELLPSAFNFDLDNFQLDTLQALDDGESVIVSAPTGSGKTVCGELGIYLALARGERVIYTTPLKALSNQKFYDLCRQFGDERVGLLTGDTNINRRGSLIVMTTEVYRNMLLKSEGDVYTEEQRLNDTLSGYDPLTDVSVVVLDEFHYMNDPYRGTIWEECCIFAPSSTQIIALSATITNANQITAWLTKIHGRTRLISTNHRPVPLNYYYCDNLGVLQFYTKKESGPGASKDEPRNVKKRRKSWKLNKKLTPEGRLEREYDFLVRKKEQQSKKKKGADFDEKGKRVRDIDLDTYKPMRPREQIPSTSFLVRGLINRNMLPAIVFIFSRVGCDEAAEKTSFSQSKLLSTAEEREVFKRVEEFRALNAELALDENRLVWLRRGVAAHHAGLLPLEKSFIESLFQDALVKVVFATETLAAGINMPARCTVLTKISKYSDTGPKLLMPSALLQMAGRAGRRGKDVLGNVIICRSMKEDAITAYKLLLQPPEPIESHFFVTYGSAAQMLRVWKVDECQSLVEKSFGSFLADVRDRMDENEISGLEEQLCEAEARIYEIKDDLKDYVDTRERLERGLRNEAFMQQNEKRLLGETMQGILPFVPTGTLVRLADGSSGLIVDEAPAAYVSKFKLDFKSMPFLLLVRTEQEKAGTSAGETDLSLRIVEPSHVVSFNAKRDEPLPIEPVERLVAGLPPYSAWKVQKDGSLGTVLEEDSERDIAAVWAAKQLSSHIESVPFPEPSASLLKESLRVRSLEEKLFAIPVHTHPKREEMIGAYLEHAELLERHAQLSKYEEEQGEGGSKTWKQFQATCQVLSSYGALNDDWEPTEFGNLVAELAGENELWLALVLVELSNQDHLEPHQLAGVLAAVVNQGLRSDAEFTYETSQVVLDTLMQLQDQAEKLYFEQLKCDVDFPILVTEAACPLVEAWASGDEWDNLITHTSLDAGDIVGIFKKTIDLLHRVSDVPFVSRRVSQQAREARRMMDRYPISDQVLTGSMSREARREAAEADEPIEVGEAEEEELDQPEADDEEVAELPEVDPILAGDV